MRFLFVCFTIVSLFSCTKFDWSNPYDPDCPKDLFTPSSPSVTMEGNSVKLTWSQQNDRISGFTLFRRAEGESITTLSQIPKSTTQYVDANITPGKKYTYYVIAVAGTNSSDTVKSEILAVFPVTISTGTITELAITSAKISANITNAGGSTVTSRGICWSTTPGPTVNNSKTTEGTGVGEFTSTLTNLLAGTTYYARAYAGNSRGISYGSEVSFTTLGLASLTTSAVIDIRATTAMSGGTINGDGGVPITAKGLVWSTMPGPTVDLATKTNEGTGLSSFTSTLVGLSPNVKYYVRAYATNATSTSYGQEISFTTLPLSLSTLTTNIATSITTTSAVSGGNITTDGGSPVTARGICWNVVGSPTIINSRTQDGSGVGVFTSSMTGLSPNTTYFVRAYATNAAGTSYGQQISFTSIALPPSLSTLTNIASSITTNSAVSGGNITADGGSPVTARGVCWNTTGSPTILNTRTQDGSGTGAFTSTMAGLTPNTTYFVRAYATNAAGTSYAQEISFTTLPPTLSAITTSATSAISTGTAISGGNIITDGGAPVTARGVCWSNTGTPTIANSITQDGSGVGAFTSNISGLSANTTYFVRAYATNAVGTSYGQQLTFTTLPPTLPTLSTNSVSSISTSSAISGGNISEDGGLPVTARGICWNTTGSPTTANTSTQDGSGTGAFTSSLTGLAPNTTYYVRAYATNGLGTSYGNEISFKTSCPLPVVTLDVSNLSWTAAPSPGLKVLNNVYGTVTNDWGLPVSSVGLYTETRNPPGAGGSFSYPGQGNRFGCGFCGVSFSTGAEVYIQTTATNVCGTGKSSIVQVTAQ